MPFDPEQRTPTNPNIKALIAPPERGGGAELSAPTPEPGKSPEKKSRKALYSTVGVVAGAAIAAGAIMGINTLNDKPNKSGSESSASADPSRSPSKTLEATPTPVETEKPFTAEILLIPTTLTPEQVATKFVTDWDAVLNANETAAFNKKALLAPQTLNDSAAQQAPKDVAIFTEAVLQSGYENNPVLAQWAGGLTTGHADTLTDWLATYKSENAADHEPYRIWRTVDNVTVVAQSATSLELKIEVTFYDNGSENTVGADTANGSRLVLDATFINEGGNWKASNLMDTQVQ